MLEDNKVHNVELSHSAENFHEMGLPLIMGDLVYVLLEWA